MAMTRPTQGSLQEAFERTDVTKPDKSDGGTAYEQGWKDGYDAGFASADDWAAQHEDAMVEHGWVRLPKDADGEYIRVGDVVTMDLMFGGKSSPLVVDRMELSHGKDGELWCIALDTDKECWNLPSLMRHHHAPTVEDVLREFAQMYIACNDKGTIAEYAAKLRLAGDE